MNISDWDIRAEQNVKIDDIYIGEHCPARNVNNAIRAIMAAMRRYQIDNDAAVVAETDVVRACADAAGEASAAAGRAMTSANAARDAAEAAAEAAAQSEGNAAASAEMATAYLFNHGVLGFRTKAELDADLGHDANSLAFVTNDSSSENNNWYIKIGASGTGSWQASDFSPATAAEARKISFGVAKIATATTRISDRLTKAELGKADRLENETAHREISSGTAKIATATARVSDRLTKIEIREAETRAAERLADIEAEVLQQRRSLGAPVSMARIDEIMMREVTDA